MRRGRRAEHGSAIVDFVLVVALLVPMVLGVFQVGLVMLVRNTLAAAASEGARHAATTDHDPADGVALTREQITSAIAGRYADHVVARPVSIGGAAGVEIVVRAEVPALGLGGPGIDLTVSGRAVEEPAR